MEDALGPSFTSAVVGNVNGEKAVDVGAVASVRVLTAEGEHACEYDVFWEDIFSIQNKYLQTRPIIMGMRPAMSNKSRSSNLLARGPMQA